MRMYINGNARIDGSTVNGGTMQAAYILMLTMTSLGLQELRPKVVFKQIIQNECFRRLVRLELIYTQIDCARECANAVPDCEAFKFFRSKWKCDLLQLERRIPCDYTYNDTWRAV